MDVACPGDVEEFLFYGVLSFEGSGILAEVALGKVGTRRVTDGCR